MYICIVAFFSLVLYSSCIVYAASAILVSFNRTAFKLCSLWHVDQAWSVASCAMPSETGGATHCVFFISVVRLLCFVYPSGKCVQMSQITALWGSKSRIAGLACQNNRNRGLIYCTRPHAYARENPTNTRIFTLTRGHLLVQHQTPQTPFMEAR